MAIPRILFSPRLIAPARAVTSPSLATSMGTPPISSAISRNILLTFFSNKSCGTLMKSDAALTSLSIYIPAALTPIASTRSIFDAALFRESMIPSY